MESWKQSFIEFMVRSDVLTFGDFVTKSGRPTPYFVNTGRYRTGDQMQQLGEFYADAILSHFEADRVPDVLFGPAYKGIPLVVTTAIAMSRRGHDTAFCFNRKEEDVTTAGTSIRETVPILRAAADVELAGLVVSVDRGERGTGTSTALAQVGDEFAMPTFAIVTIHDVIKHLSETPVDGRIVIDDAAATAIVSYLAEFGA